MSGGAWHTEQSSTVHPKRITPDKQRAIDYLSKNYWSKGLPSPKYSNWKDTVGAAVLAISFFIGVVALCYCTSCSPTRPNKQEKSKLSQTVLEEGTKLDSQNRFYVPQDNSYSLRV